MEEAGEGSSSGPAPSPAVTPPGPAWDTGGWKWVPPALLRPARPGCSLPLPRPVRQWRREADAAGPAAGERVRGSPFPSAPAQLRDRQSRTEPVLAFAQRPSPKGRCFLSEQFIKMGLSPFKALWGICAFPRCRDVSMCVSPSLFRPREEGAWQREVTFCSQYCDANKLRSSSRQSGALAGLGRG